MNRLLRKLRALWCSVVGHEPPLYPIVENIVTGRRRSVRRLRKCERCGEVLR